MCPSPAGSPRPRPRVPPGVKAKRSKAQLSKAKINAKQNNASNSKQCKAKQSNAKQGAKQSKAHQAKQSKAMQKNTNSYLGSRWDGFFIRLARASDLVNGANWVPEGSLPCFFWCHEMALDLVCGADFWCTLHCRTSPVVLEGF